ncbi:hypothetical protein GE300_11835 [Rhodobacteraceae bacterium 2CG4]|uniref:Uncharacterized protein n=1 Tax=Halovulum marinum TaxID=2662447 RepID=A0A6L5Z2R3_9RHOB|nr:BTAD domain-containing putative transcriptional regulator [Halovulum marinum]MSU90302.1 hypothetical protein [Halovulum marinum]
MAELHMTLLGRFRVTTAEGAEIRIGTRKARAALACLLMARGRPVPRDRLAGLLWSRGETRQSLASLSQALYSLRRALDRHAPGLIAADVAAVSVDASRVTVDALALEKAAREPAPRSCARCLSLYAGPFLDDLAIDTEEAYTEWRGAERVRLEGLAETAGTSLMNAWETAPETADADAIESLLRIDPYSEPAMRVKLRLLARDGRPAAALGAAERFAQRLAGDLGIAPSAGFAELADAIRAGRLATAAPAPRIPARAPVAPRRRPRHAVLAAMLVAALAGAVFLALPDPGPDPEAMRLLVRPFDAGDGVADGMAAGFGDDLSTELVRRTGLEIMSRESGRLIPEDAAARSGASHVLRGRLRAEDDQLILNLWITDLGSGREVWAGRFSAPAADPRRFRDQVLAGVAAQIDLTLAPAPPSPAPPLPHDVLPGYLRSLGLLHAGTAAANAEAIALLTPIAARFPDSVAPAAALAVAHERIAFGPDAYARAAGQHWLEGYLALKAILARHAADHPDLLAARARLALRRRDLAAAEALARTALRLEPAHVATLEVLAETYALTGRLEPAEQLAARAIALSPGAPQDGYTVLALARLARGDIGGARTAAASAREFARPPPVRLLALIAALESLAGNPDAAARAHADFVAAVESRPYAAWKIGTVTYANPRAATWRRPDPAETLDLFGFADAAVRDRLLAGLTGADPAARGHAPPIRPLAPLAGDDIRRTLFGHKIAGASSWLVQQPWRQVRTDSGALFQSGPFGPLPAAEEGTSGISGDRLCDRWIWQEVTLEACQLVFRSGDDGNFALVGELGRFAFRLAD